MAKHQLLNLNSKNLKNNFEHFMFHEEMSIAYLEAIIDEWKPKRGKVSYENYDEFVNEFLEYYESKIGKPLSKHWLDTKKWYLEHSKFDMYSKY